MYSNHATTTFTVFLHHDKKRFFWLFNSYTFEQVFINFYLSLSLSSFFWVLITRSTTCGCPLVPLPFRVLWLLCIYTHKAWKSSSRVEEEIVLSIRKDPFYDRKSFFEDNGIGIHEALRGFSILHHILVSLFAVGRFLGDIYREIDPLGIFHQRSEIENVIGTPSWKGGPHYSTLRQLAAE